MARISISRGEGGEGEATMRKSRQLSIKPQITPFFIGWGEGAYRPEPVRGRERAWFGKAELSRELENEAERIFLAGENPRGDGRYPPSPFAAGNTETRRRPDFRRELAFSPELI